MIVDSSAIIAVLRQESDAERLARAIQVSHKALMSAPTYLECSIVATKDRPLTAMLELDRLIEDLRIEIIAFTPRMARVAAMAFLEYGKGRGHPAQLNFGDCISYAVSKVEAMPLLFKGDDFPHTDVECAV